MIYLTYFSALNNHQTIDGIGHGKVSQVKYNSLSHVNNHKWQCSLAKSRHVNRLALAPVSGARESIYVQAMYPGEAQDEVTTAADGRRVSNVYEANQWLWQYGRGRPLIGGLSVSEIEGRRDAVNRAGSKRSHETRRRSEAARRGDE